MRKEYICCDLCKQPIEPWEKSHQYKMKKRWSLWYESGWEKCDVHDKCMERFYELCTNKVPDNVFNYNPSEDIVHCMECAYYSDDGYCVNHSNYFGRFFYCGYGAKQHESSN